MFYKAYLMSTKIKIKSLLKSAQSSKFYDLISAAYIYTHVNIIYYILFSVMLIMRALCFAAFNKLIIIWHAKRLLKHIWQLI